MICYDYDTDNNSITDNYCIIMIICNNIMYIIIIIVFRTRRGSVRFGSVRFLVRFRPIPELNGSVRFGLASSVWFLIHVSLSLSLYIYIYIYVYYILYIRIYIYMTLLILLLLLYYCYWFNDITITLWLFYNIIIHCHSFLLRFQRIKRFGSFRPVRFGFLIPSWLQHLRNHARSEFQYQ